MAAAVGQEAVAQLEDARRRPHDAFDPKADGSPIVYHYSNLNPKHTLKKLVLDK
jgi:hypothetical protein